MNRKPSPFSERFLGWFCKEQYLEEIIGDLCEYHDELMEKPRWKRGILYWFHVFNFLQPWALKKFSGAQKINNYGMLKNYFKVIWRDLLRQKTYSIINIGGLSLGLTCFLLIFLYIRHEKSYDRFYENSPEIHRVYQQNKGQFYRDSDAVAYTTVGLAPAMITEIPEVLNPTVIHNQTALIGNESGQHSEQGLRGDTHFFDVFKHKLIQGNPNEILSSAEAIVISKSLSKKLFGNKNPIGREVQYNEDIKKVVTGVMADIPLKSSLKFSFVTSMLSSQQYINDVKNDRWGNNDYHTFFTINEQVNHEIFEDKLTAMVNKYLHESGRETGAGQIRIQPISELHLETYLNFDIGQKGKPEYVNLFSFIAVVILFLACINYMNLSITRSIRRSKEVGIRKVIGAKKLQVTVQFLIESIVMTSFALVLSLVFTYFLTPLFGQWIESPVGMNLLKDGIMLPFLLFLVVIVGTLSGSYPAFFISSLKPVLALKGKTKQSFSGIKIQRGLIVAQYATSIILIVGSLVIYKQFRYMQEKELGYQKEHILTLQVFDGKLRSKIETLRNEWSQNPNILAVTATSELPTNVTSGTMVRNTGIDLEERFLMYRARIDEHYIDLFDLKLIAGRNYSKDIESDFESGRVINESAARALGWDPLEAVGKSFIESKRSIKTVIGVVKDFHMHSMHMEIGPLLLVPRNGYFDYIALKLRANNLPETIASIEKSIGKHSLYPFEYKFLDDKFNELYKSELKLGEMFGVFTLLALTIASLGLFGLAAFQASQRKKEIGIRKVLGASVQSITSILASDFLKLVVFGFVIAAPVAWFAMNKWLEDFAYRINIEWWMFVLAGGAALLIALLTISSQSIKAALTNPVNCLQNE